MSTPATAVPSRGAIRDGSGLELVLDRGPRTLRLLELARGDETPRADHGEHVVDDTRGGLRFGDPGQLREQRAASLAHQHLDVDLRGMFQVHGPAERILRLGLRIERQHRRGVELNELLLLGPPGRGEHRATARSGQEPRRERVRVRAREPQAREREHRIAPARVEPRRGLELPSRFGPPAAAPRPEPAQVVRLGEPWLPEAHYLSGLWAWRGGRRAEARRELETAAGLDSSWRDPVLALSRLRLPGTNADSLPTRFLTGARSCAMLTSPRRPKQEEFIQFDSTPMLAFNPQSQPEDSLRRAMHLKHPTQVYIQ